MCESSEVEGADPSKAGDQLGLCSPGVPEGADPSKAPLSGSVCSFERPLERGEAEIWRLAGRQHHCLHRYQLYGAGVGRKWLAARLRDRRIHILHSNVVVLHEPPWDRLTYAMGAVLHFRGDAALAAAYATWLWELTDGPPNEPEVVVVGRSSHPVPGVAIHRAPSLDPGDIRWRKGLPVTSPARSLIDFAPTATDDALESALATGRRKNLFTERQLDDALSRVPSNRAGVKTLRALRARPPESLAATRSAAERAFRRLLRAARLPAPQVNHPLQRHECDFVFEPFKLIVEIDGWEFHKHRWQQDHARDARLIAGGWTVIRIPARRLTAEPYAVIVELAAALSHRGWAPRPAAA